MTFGKKTLFFLLLGLVILVNILELTHFNFLYTSTLISFCTYILLPGFLISLILRIKKISFWENILVIVGLSIAFLEFGGLLLNILLPLFGVNDPLTFQNLIIGFDLYILLLIILAWKRTEQFIIRIQLPKRSKIEKVLYTLPVFFPLLATLGAIVLNNGGSGILTLILLGTIAFYSLLLLNFREKISVDLFPYAIFFIGIACLFSTSLRSWYISGHDIEREFYVFKLTNTFHIWNIAFYHDAYNACLSITILPTILTNLLFVQDIYVYKVIFQILFATSPVIVFFIQKTYTSPVLAFLSAFLFVSFPTFFNDMPWINRQEIGFIFFGLALYIMLNRAESQLPSTELASPSLSAPSLSIRRSLFIIFALGVIVSHYSTNFVLLVSIAFVYISTLLISLPFIKKTFALLISKSPIRPKNTFPNKAFLNLPLILLLFLMTIAWNNLYTQTSNHTGTVLEEVINSLFIQSSAKSSDISYSIFFPPPKKNSQQELQMYIQSVKQEVETTYRGKVNINQFYGKSISDKYPTFSLSQDRLPPTPYGQLFTAFGIPIFNDQAALRSLSASFMQIFLLIGLLALFFLKNEKTFDLQYLLLCIGALFLLALITLLPALSLEYGVLRMFQQLLFVISYPIVLGLNSILFFIHKQRRILLIGVIEIFFFLNLTGFLSHLTGDYYPTMTLENAGLYYNAYYVQGSDILAISWLLRENNNDEPIESDQSGTNKLLLYGNINAINGDLPAVILKNAYVYFETSTYTEATVDRTTFFFSSPKSFLDDTKNLIYSNGKDNIYK